MDTEGSKDSYFGCIPFKPDERDIIQSTLQKTQPITNSNAYQLVSDITLDHVAKSKVDAANNLFSFNGWSDRIINLNVDYIEQEMNLWSVGVTAIVRVILKDGSFHENIGFSEVNHSSKGTAIREAKNKAVMIARQQCLQLYGMFFSSSDGTSSTVNSKEDLNSETSSAIPSQMIDSILTSQPKPTFETKSLSSTNSVKEPEERRSSSHHPTESSVSIQSPVLNKSIPNAVNASSKTVQPQQPQQLPQGPQPSTNTSSFNQPMTRAKSLEQVTEADMEGLEDIDLSNLAIEMSPTDPVPNPAQHPAQSIQMAKPFNSVIPANLPTRNQAVQGIQPNVMIRSSDGSPMLRPPIQMPGTVVHEMINTAQGNSFSSKRSIPYISFCFDYYMFFH